MQSKTIFIIITTALLTIFLMLNTEAVDFDFLVTTVPISKLVVIGICILIGFILGYISAKPKSTVSSYDDELKFNKEEDEQSLSDEDRDYIKP